MSSNLRVLINGLYFADKSLRKDGAVDGPLLRDLRLALDNLRLTAWTVSQAQVVNQVRTANAISFLRTERLVRFRQVVDAFCSDLERDGTGWSFTAIHELQESVGLLRERLGLLTLRQRNRN